MLVTISVTLDRPSGRLAILIQHMQLTVTSATHPAAIAIDADPHFESTFFSID